MPLVNANCPSCGATIEVNPEAKTLVCRFCGSSFIVEQAINNYNSYITNNIQGNTVNVTGNNGNININGKNIDALITRGKDKLLGAIGDDNEAKSFLKDISNDILNIDANNFYGLLFSGVANKNSYENEKALNVATDEEKEFYFNSYIDFISLTLEHFENNLDVYTDLNLETAMYVMHNINLSFMLLALYTKTLTDIQQNKYNELKDTYYNYILKTFIQMNKAFDDYRFHFYEKVYFYEEDYKIYILLNWAIECLKCDTSSLKNINNKIYDYLVSIEWGHICRLNKPAYIAAKNFIEELAKFIEKDDDFKHKAFAWEHTEQTSTSKNGCYVATCVYGSYDCSEVWMLRRYRDNYLDNHYFGKIFIKIYYAISPTLVKWFGNDSWFRNCSKKILDKKIKKLKNKGYDDTPYNDKY